MREEYLPHARQSLAASALPDGAAFYRAQIRRYVTLDLTPGEIHARGLRRGRADPRLRWKRSSRSWPGKARWPSSSTFLRTDPQFYAKTPDELMGVSAYVDKRMDARIHDVLGFLPRQRHTIAPGAGRDRADLHRRARRLRNAA
jgi:uncharacterized protein (DUF885 family)